MSENYMIETRWTWREKWRFRLMPSQPCPLPDAPASYADVVETTTLVHLPILDRLRVLCFGALKVQTRTVTENIVGDTKTASVAYPCFRRQP